MPHGVIDDLDQSEVLRPQLAPPRFVSQILSIDRDLRLHSVESYTRAYVDTARSSTSPAKLCTPSRSRSCVQLARPDPVVTVACHRIRTLTAAVYKVWPAGAPDRSHAGRRGRSQNVQICRGNERIIRGAERLREPHIDRTHPPNRVRLDRASIKLFIDTYSFTLFPSRMRDTG
jgi:hypothetical protein